MRAPQVITKVKVFEWGDVSLVERNTEYLIPESSLNRMVNPLYCLYLTVNKKWPFYNDFMKVEDNNGFDWNVGLSYASSGIPQGTKTVGCDYQHASDMLNHGDYTLSSGKTYFDFLMLIEYGKRIFK